MKNFEDFLKQGLETQKAIIFTGAGFSKGMINIDNTEPLDAKNLAITISELGGFEKDEDLKYVADRYIDENSNNLSPLITLLEHQFTIKSVRTAHKEICNANWLRFYTTNYDKGIENACSMVGKNIKTINIQDSVTENAHKENLCIHINGTIDTLNSNTIRKNIKLSNSSYLSAENFKSSEWYRLFKSDLEKSKVIIFVGYSMYDIDIESILFENSIFKDKTFFIVGKDSSDTKAEYKLKKYGNVIKENYDFLAQVISNLNIDPNPKEKHIFSSFQVIEQESPTNKFISDSEIKNFFIYGTYDNNYLARSFIETNNSFAIAYRTHLNTAISDIENNYDLVITGELGNGKSVFCDMLSLKLMQKGFTIFSLIDPSGDFKSDIDLIMKKNEDTIIVLEDFTNNSDILSYIKLTKNTRIRLIISSRIAEYNKSIHNDNIDITDFKKINLDYLDTNELEQFVSIFDNLGIWGEDASKSTHRKAKSIMQKNQISLILIEFLKSEQIKNRISPIIKELLATELKNTIFAISILKILNITPTSLIVSDITEDDIIYDVKNDSNTMFLTLFSKKGGCYEAKSSFFSSWLIQNYFDVKYTMMMLHKMSKKFDKLRDTNEQACNQIFYSTLRFSFVERLISNKKQNLPYYYDNLKKEVTWLQHQPHFWMQYAMAMMVCDDLSTAQTYLDQAYSYADNQHNYNVTSINSQQARLFIKQGCFSTNGIICFDYFHKAHRLLIALPNDHYKYRQILEYQTFYEKSFDKLNKVNKAEFSRLCKAMLESIQNADSSNHYSSHTHTIKTLRELCRETTN